jgi:hypothetical protein
MLFQHLAAKQGARSCADSGSDERCGKYGRTQEPKPGIKHAGCELSLKIPTLFFIIPSVLFIVNGSGTHMSDHLYLLCSMLSGNL